MQGFLSKANCFMLFISLAYLSVAAPCFAGDDSKQVQSTGTQSYGITFWVPKSDKNAKSVKPLVRFWNTLGDLKFKIIYSYKVINVNGKVISTKSVSAKSNGTKDIDLWLEYKVPVVHDDLIVIYSVMAKQIGTPNVLKTMHPVFLPGKATEISTIDTNDE